MRVQFENDFTTVFRTWFRVMAMAALIEMASGDAIGQLQWDAEFKEIESNVTATSA